MTKPTKRPTTLNPRFRGSRNKRLEAVANRILGKSGFAFPMSNKRKSADFDAWEAEQIGQNGRLKATWIGRP